MSVTQAPHFEEGLNVTMPVEALHESDDNPRYITEEALDRLKYALTADPDMMRARPIITTEHGEVICGNMRLRAARELGWLTVPTYVHSFRDDAEKREWMLRDNQEYGDWVPDQLAQMIADHAAGGFDTRLLGFNDDEVMAAIRRATGDAIVPEPSDPPSQTLAAECMVEIRCSRAALNEIRDTLEMWDEDFEDLTVGVSE